MKKKLLNVILMVPFCLWGQVDPQDVEIIRDGFGVPHIYGKTDASTCWAPPPPVEVANSHMGLLYHTTFSIREIQSKIFLKAAV